MYLDYKGLFLLNTFEINEGGMNYIKFSSLRIIYKNSSIQLDIFPYDQYYKTTLNQDEICKLDNTIRNTCEIFYENYHKGTGSAG